MDWDQKTSRYLARSLLAIDVSTIKTDGISKKRRVLRIAQLGTIAVTGENAQNLDWSDQF